MLAWFGWGATLITMAFWFRSKSFWTSRNKTRAARRNFDTSSWLDNLRRSLFSDNRNAIVEFFALTQPFDSAAYMNAEEYLRNQGEETVADEIFLARRQREHFEPIPESEAASATSREPWRRLWLMGVMRTVFDISMGYGVRVRRLLYLFVMLWLLTWAVFVDPRSVERPLTYVQPKGVPSLPVPSYDLASPNPWDAEGGNALGEDSQWGLAHAFFLSLRIEFPIITLFAENNWVPASREIVLRKGEPNALPLGITYENYASVMMLINLVLIPTLIAAETGFLKRKLG
ncbi:MAG: hypothetical protein QM811_07655 [Pirellulales bacterium]